MTTEGTLTSLHFLPALAASLHLWDLKGNAGEGNSSCCSLFTSPSKVQEHMSEFVWDQIFRGHTISVLGHCQRRNSLILCHGPNPDCTLPRATTPGRFGVGETRGARTTGRKERTISESIKQNLFNFRETRKPSLQMFISMTIKNRRCSVFFEEDEESHRWIDGWSQQRRKLHGFPQVRGF